MYEPHNLLRLVTGVLQGLVLASFLLPLFNSTLWKDTSPEASIGNLGDFMWLILAGAGVVLLVASEWSFLLYPLYIISGFAIVALIGSLNTMALLVTLHREGGGQSWRDLVSPCLGGVALGIIELILIGWTRDALTAWAGIAF